MDESMRRALAGILADYEQRRSRELAARQAQQASLDQFLVNVTGTLDEVVAPCFERFAEELKTRHHVCSIEAQMVDPADRRSDVMIKLTIFRDGVKLPNGNASLSYIALPHRQRMSVHRSITTRDGGVIPGTVAEYELTQIVPSLVDQNLLELAETVFAAA
jgi:hypothetical protein